MGGEAWGGRTSKATAAALGIPSCVRAGPAAGESIRNCWKRERVGAAGRASSAASQSLAGLGAWRSRFAVWAAAGRSETEIRTRLAGGPGATRTSTVFILFPRR
jgi:hypothetical protein